MSDYNYEDLQFVVEKFIDWEQIAKVKGSDNYVDEFMMTLKTAAIFCENQVAPTAEGIDKEECSLVEDENGKKKELKTAQIFVEVKSVLEDKETAKDIKDIKPIATIKRDYTLLIGFSVAFLLLLVLIIAVTKYIDYRST